MTVYHPPMSLGQVISTLRSLGKAPVRGVGPEIHSYRGWYERAAVDQPTASTPADELADKLLDQAGMTMTGYKGGDYTISLAEPVHVARQGDLGPYIAGFAVFADGVYQPVLVDEEL